MALSALTSRSLATLLIGLACAACATRTDLAGSPQPATLPATEQATAGSAGVPGSGEAPAPAAPGHAASPNPWAEPARNVLLPHCGRCHDGSLDSSLQRARAVYDLSEAAWYARIAPQQYDGLLRRVRGVDGISETDRSVVERFVRCARDNECNE